MWDTVEIVTALTEPSEVTRLPKGAVVGDVYGGRSFTDNVAAALERRSCGGWRDVRNGDQRWTLILIER
jgi:hypothetical protein